MNPRNWDERARQKAREDKSDAMVSGLKATATAAGEAAKRTQAVADHAAAVSRFIKPRIPRPDNLNHKEAFCLMWYACEVCHGASRIWNSRDGVTPFGMMCPNCGSIEMRHVAWHLDEYAPEHKLNFGQYFWRDITMEDCERIRARPGHHWAKLSEDEWAKVCEDLKASVEKGCPHLDIFTGGAA